jgi:hypothetical protein
LRRPLSSFRDDFVAWLFICLGVVISIVLPMLSSYVRNQFGVGTAGIVDLKKYGALALFSALTAIIVPAIYRQAEPDKELIFFLALLTGYGWEATIEKIGFGPKLQ